MDAAVAAGYAMAPEDIYAAEDVAAEQPVAMTAPRSTALVPLPVSTPTGSLMAQARSIASRYAYPAWLLPRLTA
jgi:hypothetical protein